MKTNRFTDPTTAPNPLSRRAALGLGASVAAGLLLDANLFAAAPSRKVVIWSEGTANVDAASKKVYPEDINSAIAEGASTAQGRGLGNRQSLPGRPQPGG